MRAQLRSNHKKIAFILLALVTLGGFSIESFANGRVIHLKDYAPLGASSGTHLVFSNGASYAYYSYERKSPWFSFLFDLFQQGDADLKFSWAKQYWNHTNSTWNPHPHTYAQLQFNKDGSVMEIGDWLNFDGNGTFVPFGYKSAANGQNSGLAWVPVGGFVVPGAQGFASGAAHSNVFAINNGSFPGSNYHDIALLEPSGALREKVPLAYSYMVAEYVGDFTPQMGTSKGKGLNWGDGKTYQNVIRLIHYHGTAFGNVSINCYGRPEVNLNGDLGRPDHMRASQNFYAKVPNYASYVSEYYLAPGKWIIQERLLYAEDPSWFNQNNVNGPQMEACGGALFNTVDNYTMGAKYIDDR